MGTGNEVMGSRKTKIVQQHRTGVGLYVSDDGTTDVPLIGSVCGWTTETAFSKACLKMRVTQVDADPTSIPGLWIHTVQYAAFREFA